jgi:multisubunit Na+/H+ antiporter MnhG subunit
MSPATSAATSVVVMLTLALLVCALSSLGLLVMRGFYQKMHYLAPPAILATAAIAGAILLQEGLSSSAIKGGLVLLVMVISNPVLTFAAARANYLRETQAERQREAASQAGRDAPPIPTAAPDSPTPAAEERE